MRTIIINTLGRDLPRHDLFFLPFRDDQLFWLNKDMGGIGACAEEIEALYSAQDRRQDYRLVVLADLAGYDSVDKEIVRTCYQQLLKAYLNHALIQPLADQRQLPPKNVTIIFVITRKTLGGGNVQPERVLDYVLALDEEKLPVGSLELVRQLPGGTEHLDISDTFRVALDTHCASMPENPDEQARRSTLKFLRQSLEERTNALQKCVYTPVGFVQTEQLPLSAVEFFPQSSSPDLIWADLQLNLSEFLAKENCAPRGKQVDLKLTAHTDEELAFRVARGTARVRYLLTDAPGQTYYPLVNQPNCGTEDLYNRIWAALLEQEQLLPGVREAKEHSEGQMPLQGDGLGAKLHRAWLRVGQERKLFGSLCDQLDQEYNEDAAKEQQQRILDVCAGEFRSWRGAALRQDPQLPAEPKAGPQPELDTEQLEEKLQKAQLLCGRMAAEKLDDYEDLRQEAEEIKAAYRQASRFWAPDCGNANTKHFQIYSLVLAALFLIQMLVPYVGITMGQSGVEISRYVHFLESAGVFLGLYLVGLLFWLRQLCRDLHMCSEQMSDLILRSSQRRRDSIEAVVKSYAQALPQCTLLHEDLRELRSIHGANQARKARYHTHLDCLKRAEELLRELDTQLQLPFPDMGRLYKQERVVRGIDYQRPPSDRRNIPYYMLLSEDWGDKPC